MLVCIYCGEESSADYNFCERCYRQLRCTSPLCGSLLKANAPICLKCGRKVGAREDAQQTPNVYEEDVRQTQKSFTSRRRLQVATEAVGYLAPLVLNQVQPRPPRRQPDPDGNGLQPPLQLQPPLLPDGPLTDGSDAGVEDISLPIVGKEAASAVLRARSIFDVVDGGQLIAKQRDLKGTTKKEQQRRLIVMYAWAYDQIFGKPVPEKEHFNFAARKAGAYDDNFRSSYLGKTLKEFFNDLGNGYRLTSDGEKKADTVLSEIADEGKAGYAYWESSARATRKAGRINADSRNRVREWTGEHVDLGSIDVRNLTRPRDCALFALWAITVYLKKVSAVKPVEAYLFMKEKYQAISVSGSAFRRTLSRPYNAKYFEGTPDGLYFLKPDGEKVVEAWRGGEPIQSTEPTDTEEE